jgi:hypothetical protein
MLRFLGRFAVFFCSKVPKMNGNAPFLSRFFRLNKGLKVGGDAPIFPQYFCILLRARKIFPQTGHCLVIAIDSFL